MPHDDEPLFALIGEGEWCVSFDPITVRRWREAARDKIVAIGSAWMGTRSQSRPGSNQARDWLKATEAFAASAVYAELKAGAIIASGRRVEDGGLKVGSREDFPPQLWRSGAVTLVGKTELVAVRRDDRSLVYFSEVMVREAATPPEPAVTASRGPSETHSGMPGRPTTPKQLYLDQLKRRHAAGEMLPMLRDEAKALLSWLKNARPDLNHGAPGTIENTIRDRYRQLNGSTK